MRLFFALAAVEGMIVTFGDSTNAYQMTPLPTLQCYLEIDEAYCSWYKKRFGKELKPNGEYVLPVK